MKKIKRGDGGDQMVVLLVVSTTRKKGVMVPMLALTGKKKMVRDSECRWTRMLSPSQGKITSVTKRRGQWCFGGDEDPKTMKCMLK